MVVGELVVGLRWNVQGYLYQSGVITLRETLYSATDAINEKLSRAIAAVEKFDSEVAEGSDPRIERDDEGWVIDDHRDNLIYEMNSIEETKAALNKAFAITLFHHWERAARGWTGDANGQFKSLCALVTAKGYPISPKLNDIRIVVNLLKHANSYWGAKVIKYRKDLLRPEFDPDKSYINWYDAVLLTDVHIDEMFQIVESSGPDGKLVTPHN